MVLFLRRILIVCLFGMGSVLLLQGLLSRDNVAETYFTLTAAGADGAGWTLKVDELGAATLDGRAATLDAVVEKLRSTQGELKLTAAGAAQAMNWEATIAGGAVTLRGAQATMAELTALVYRSAQHFEPTRTPSVQEVLDAAAAGKIITPTRSKVSFPNFSYKDAFPDADDEAEITIEHFQDCPWLTDLDRIPRPDWRSHFDENLPPIAERLPENPAVVVGPDGIGQYGGVWRRCWGGGDDGLRKVYSESFVRFDPAGRLQPALAYKWTVEDNNRVYTFYLRKGHKWSDGEPFTVEDILWVTNTIIGSAYWANSPNWMMETDGTALLGIDDILDWPGLRRRICREAGSEDPSVGRQLIRADRERHQNTQTHSEKLLSIVEQIPPQGEPDEALKFKVIDALNSILRKASFFDAEALGGIDFDSELKALKTRGASTFDKAAWRRAIMLMDRKDLFRRGRDEIDQMSPSELNRLNLFMFRANYAGLVDRARITKVKIEAVADETGDAGHIIRFTFPKPNAIFLDKATTFMFYRGLFETPKHFTRHYHPAGVKELEPSDILDWAGLFETIRRQASSDRPSPGKQAWSLLAASIKDEIEDNAPSEDSSEAYKQRIVDALNAVLADRRFWTEGAWEGIDFDAAYDELLADGFSMLRRNRSGMNLAKQMLIRADLLRRVRERGIDDLNEAELLDFNVFLFRAAYDSYAGTALVAVNREDGLNVTAQNHPNRYSTWLSLARNLGKYKKDQGFDYPTLKAWRNITEKIERTVISIRNPYYYKVDAEGNQLPYIDAIESTQETNPPNVMLSLSSGNVDFQCRGLTFEHFPFLKSKEDLGGYEIRIWPSDYVGEVNFHFLQAHKDEQLKKLFGDKRFRHAMSMAINRQEIIDVVYNGLGSPAQFSVPAGSPYYNARQAATSVAYNPEEANRILDELGLAERASDGIRKLPDGRSAIINIDCTEGEIPLTAIQMVCAYWREVGINARMKVRGWSLLSRMQQMGTLDVGVTKEGGNFFGPLQAGGFAPTHNAEAVQWGQWVNYIRSGGRIGWEAPEEIVQIDRLWNKVLGAPDEPAKIAAWQALAERTAEDLPRIGLMTSPGKMIYVNKRFKNVPKLALAGWIAHQPANCCPEVFYIDQE